MGTPVDFHDRALYDDPTLNPMNKQPDNALATAFKRAYSGTAPLQVLIALMGADINTGPTFASSFGTKKEEVEDKMLSCDEIVNNLTPGTGARRRGEIGFLVTVWEELAGRQAARTKIRDENATKDEPTTIRVPDEIKTAVKQRFKVSVHALYYPPTPLNTPHDKFWNEGQSRLDQLGHMPFFYVHECRAQSEDVEKASVLGADTKSLHLGSIYYLWTEVGTSEEILTRRGLYFKLAHFLDQSTFEHGVAFIHVQREWIAKRRPSFEAVHHCDRHAVKAMVDRVKEGDSATFSESLQWITANLREFQVDAMLQNGIDPGKVEVEERDGVIDRGPAKPKNYAVGPDGAPLLAEQISGAFGGKGKGKSTTKGTPVAPGKAASVIQDPAAWTQPITQPNWSPPGEGKSKAAKKRKRDSAAKAAAAAAAAAAPPPKSPPPPNKEKGGKGNKGKTKDKGKDKGKGKGKTQQPPVPPSELAWMNKIANWGNPTRCKFFNCSLGCVKTNCGFPHQCFLCGQYHSMVWHHYEHEIQALA